MARIYRGALLALIAAVAVARWDLLAPYVRGEFARGGVRVLLENALLGGILLLPFWLIPAEASPAKDLAAALCALPIGWALEAWGTRAGLWTYYTGEAPPLWILPGWSLGVLVVERLAPRFKRAFPSADIKVGYWTFTAAFAAAFILFSKTAFFEPASVCLWGFLLAALCYRPVYGDYWVLCAGMAAAFSADLWGMTNNCWTYYPQSRPGSWSPGPAAFGMLLDAAAALTILKTARYIFGKKNPVRSR